MPKFKDRTGIRYGMLTAIETVNRGDGSLIKWRCRCDCGNECSVNSGNLATGNTYSCGCHKLEVLMNRCLKHGHARLGKHTRTYFVWSGMFNRCYDKNNPGYKNYGERGITVCNRWHKFENFLADMGEKPNSLMIERVDNNKGYSKGNCIWATRTVQNRNTRQNRVLKFKGEKRVMSDWSERLGIPYDRIRCRLDRGWSVSRALTATKLVNQFS